MNHNLKHLYDLASRPSRRIIGLMSGTSMDGLDIALCHIEGHGGATKVKLLNFETVDYTDDIKAEIRKVFAKQTIDFQHLTLLNAWIGRLHGEMILSCLKKWDIDVRCTMYDVRCQTPDTVGLSSDIVHLTSYIDLVASHGQTVFHAPKILHGIEKFPNATLQIGDGDHVAVTTGIITLSDFRQRHIAAGGEGAPLAVYGDYFIFSDPSENRIMLNMGGIANFTYLPASLDASEVFVTDTGTGNTLLDAFVRRFFQGKAYDKDAEIASKGTVIPDLLKTLKSDDFFKKPFPKTTGPELFSIEYVEKAIKSAGCTMLDVRCTMSDVDSTSNIVHRTSNIVHPADLLATLTRFSAETIAEALRNVFIEKQFTDAEIRQFKIYMSGGGMHNPLLVNWLKELLPEIAFRKTDDLGINGDAKEAVLFAILANECIAGNPTNFGNRAGVPSISMGKISFPQ